MDIAIVGGGIGGLTLALALHQHGIPCRVYEGAPEVRELGVGITLLPHAMRELTALGLGEALASQGIENRESCFFNRFGQLIHAEPRGRAAGYPVPEVGIHRGGVRCREGRGGSLRGHGGREGGGERQSGWPSVEHRYESPCWLQCAQRTV